MRDFCKQVLSINALVLICAFAASYGTSLLLIKDDLLSTLLFLGISFVITTLCSFFIGMTKSEQKLVLEYATKKLLHK
jgi:hypothetical protein